MAMALPVAAFDMPVHREYLGDLGVYARAGDAAALARAIRTLLSDPADAARRGRALRLEAISRYTWARAAEQIERVYDTVIGLRRGGD